MIENHNILMIWERMTSAIMDGCLSHLEAWVMIKAKICASMPHILYDFYYIKSSSTT